MEVNEETIAERKWKGHVEGNMSWKKQEKEKEENEAKR